MSHDGINRLGDGEPAICQKCNEPFRLISRLPGAERFNYCPTCFEEVMNGN